MQESDGASRRLAQCRRNRAAFMLAFSAISLLMWQRSGFPMRLYALVSGIIFLAIAAAYLRTYFTWTFGAKSDEELVSELRKTYTSKKIIDDVSALGMEDLNRIAAEESMWLKSYISYIKFGILWGILYAASLLLRVRQFGSIDDWMASIFFNSIMLFVLGKSILDLFDAKIDSGFARMAAAQFAGYAPIFILAGLFGDATFFDAPLSFAEEIAVRLLIIWAAAIAYEKSGSDLPK